MAGAEPDKTPVRMADGDAEYQDREVDADRHFVRKREFRQPTDQQREQAVGQRHTGQRPHQRQGQGLRQKLAANAPAAGPNGAAHGQFMLSGGAARQQQDENVRASDQQKQRYRAEQQEEGLSQMLHVLVIETFYAGRTYRSSARPHIQGSYLRHLNPYSNDAILAYRIPFRWLSP